MPDSQSIAVHAIASHVLMSFSVDEMQLPRYVNLSISFRGPPFSVEMSPFWLKHMYSVVSALTWRLIPPAVGSRLCSWDSVWAGVFARSVMSSASSASVIICAGYLLLLSFASVKPFSFITSIDVRSTLSRQIINRYGANVSPCSTPATMSK